MRFKKFIIYLILLVFAALSIFIINGPLLKHYSKLIFPLFWIILSILVFALGLWKNERIKAKSEKRETLLIIVIVHITIWFFSGLIFTYARSPYNQSLSGIITNLWMFILVAGLQEFVRASLINKKSSIKSLIYITLAFSCFDISFIGIDRVLASNELIFKFLFNSVLISLVKNSFLSYLTRTGGLTLALSYKLPLLAIKVFLPIIPNLDPFIASIFDIILIIILFIFVNKVHLEKTGKKINRRRDTKSLKTTIILLVLTVLVSSFSIGLFRYMPIAIMSNSMYPLIKRGDVVVIEKLNQEQKENLEVNDIIQYQFEKFYVIHRITKIEKINGDYYFTTKGDNNNSEDLKKVKLDQVYAKVKLRVPYVGYPSVLLNDFLTNDRDLTIER